MGKIYGYCRISTPKQSLERQIRNIREAFPQAIIIQEIYTGTSQDRPRWMLLQKGLKKGDKIIFDSVSRMSRNAEEGITAYTELYHRGVELVFLKEPHINTELYKKALEGSVELTGGQVDIILSAVNQYLLILAREQIFLAFQQAQKEVDDLRQMTKEGIEIARLEGKQIGAVKGKKLTTKKSIKAKKIMQKHVKEFGGSLSDKECMELTHLSRNTYYKYKKELKEELSQKQIFN